jgi:hypothetical protein
MAQTRWVYKIQDDYSDEEPKRVAREAAKKAPARLVRVVKKDAQIVLTEKLRRQVRKEVEELTPEERAALAKALSRPRHLTKSERPEDRVALAGIIEKDGGGMAAIDLEREDGSSQLVGDGRVSRLDVGEPVKKRRRRGYLDGALDGITSPLASDDENPGTTRLIPWR